MSLEQSIDSNIKEGGKTIEGAETIENKNTPDLESAKDSTIKIESSEEKEEKISQTKEELAKLLNKEVVTGEFKKKEFTEDGTIYVFDHVAVKIDTSGKNYKELPELIFGTFDIEPSKDSLNKPSVQREGVDMNYISECIKKVANDSSVHEFWFYPFGDDAPKEEEKGQREQARLRLFQKLGNITTAPTGYGYILKV